MKFCPCVSLEVLEIPRIPVKAQGFEALEPFFCHGTAQASLETLQLSSLVLTPNAQGRVWMVRGHIAVSMAHKEGFQALKVLLPAGSMRIPDETHTTKEIFSLITEGRMMATVLQLVLVSLPLDPLGQLLIGRVGMRHKEMAIVLAKL